MIQTKNNPLRIAAATLLVAILTMPAKAQQTGAFSGGEKITILSIASNNSQLVGIPGPHLVLGITALNTTAADVFLRLYDVDTAPDCTSAANNKGHYPVFAKASGGGFVDTAQSTFVRGIGICITGAYGLTDNTAAATGTSIVFTVK